MTPPTIRTLIFDFGNVLGFFDHQITWNKVAEHTHLTMPELLTAIRERDLEDRYETGHMSSEEFVAALQTAGQFRCEPNFIRSAWKDIFTPNNDLCSLLPKFKANNYRLQLGSNTNDLHAEQFLEQFKTPLKLLDAITLSHEIGHRKPRAEFFADCHAKSGHAPEECVFIDDLPANIQGARDYGMQGIVFTDVANLNLELSQLGVRI